MENDQQEPKAAVDVRYYNISVKKLVLLSICTFGIYEIYWHYKNWEAIRDQAGENVSAPWRAWFCLFTCYDLFKRIKTAILNKGYSVVYSAGQLATLYILMNLCGRFGSRYDNKIANFFWVISFFTVIPIVVVQKAINSYNASIDVSYKINDNFNWKSIIVIVLGGILLVLSVLGIFLPSPN